MEKISIDDDIKDRAIRYFNGIHDKNKEKFYNLSDCEIRNLNIIEIFSYDTYYLTFIRDIAERNRLYKKDDIKEKFARILSSALHESSCSWINEGSFHHIFDVLWDSNHNRLLREKVWEYRPWYQRMCLGGKFIATYLILAIILHIIIGEFVFDGSVNDEIYSFMLMPLVIACFVVIGFGQFCKSSFIPFIYSFILMLGYLYFSVFPVQPMHQVVYLGRYVLFSVLFALLSWPIFYLISGHDKDFSTKKEDIKMPVIHF